MKDSKWFMLLLTYNMLLYIDDFVSKCVYTSAEGSMIRDL